MTAIIARTGLGRPEDAVAVAAQMLNAMASRGHDQSVTTTIGSATLGASWHAWETDAAGTAKRAFAQHPTCAVAADATLYYRDALRRSIEKAGVRVGGDSSAELILAAYEAFGPSCVEALEGDFAFVLWDARESLLLAARDFIGKRPLHFSASKNELTIASTIGGVHADRRVAPDLDLGSIAAVAAGLWSHFPETCYAAISELPAGHVLSWRPGTTGIVSRFWSPPDTLDPAPSSVDEGAEELRRLLAGAVDERMAVDRPTALSLSGGWDSTAVLAAGQHVLGSRAQTSRSIRPVSISYPVGDPGREDELIAESASFWHLTPAWIDINTVSMFDHARDRARARDEPPAHPFEEWHRALAATSLGAGARVLLDGSGGDQLFQVSDVVLADLVRSGRLLTAWREWRSRGGTGLRSFLRAGVRPALSDKTLRLLATVRGLGTPAHYLDRGGATWFRDDFFQRERVLERELAARPALPRTSTMLAEMHAMLVYPYFPRVTSRVAAFSIDEGVEARSPLLDNRVVQFAARRPWYERAKGKESKILLRRAMQGLVPDSVLAPRPVRTGITSGYFTRSLLVSGRAFIEDLVGVPVMAGLGMVDPARLRRAWEHYRRTGHDETGARIYFTIQTELWLREKGM